MYSFFPCCCLTPAVACNSDSTICASCDAKKNLSWSGLVATHSCSCSPETPCDCTYETSGTYSIDCDVTTSNNRYYAHPTSSTSRIECQEDGGSFYWVSVVRIFCSCCDLPIICPAFVQLNARRPMFQEQSCPPNGVYDVFSTSTNSVVTTYPTTITVTTG